MQQTVLACKKHNIAVGAHPGLPDIQGFGRREIKMTPEELTAAVRYQVGALKAFLDAEDMPLHHVKPHGVMYGMMYRDKDICRAVYAGVPKGTTVFGLAGTLHEEVAREMGLPFVAEIYGDVKYNSDKTLVIDRKKKYFGPCYSSYISRLTNYLCSGHGIQMRRGNMSAARWRTRRLRLSRARNYNFLLATTQFRCAATRTRQVQWKLSRRHGKSSTNLTARTTPSRSQDE